MTLPKTETRYVPVQFTNEQLQEIGLKLAETHQAIDRLEKEKKDEADRYKGLIAEKQTEASKLSTDRVNGYHIEPMECAVEYDFRAGTKSIIRPDTTEVVATLPLSADERQLEIADISTRNK